MWNCSGWRPSRNDRAIGAVIVFMKTMRLWSVHPSLLDRMGLLALWREGLLAQRVLLGKTSGYRFHPQLKRFQACRHPVTAISTYLWSVVDEARLRGYTFDASKIAKRRRRIVIPLTRCQLEFEREHLRKKLRLRDRERAGLLSTTKLRPHPMLRVVEGDIEDWEVV
jgi:pyrimidine dimer DNA glycosylase